MPLNLLSDHRGAGECCCCHLGELWCVQIILCKVFFVQEEFFSESIIFRLNMDSKTLFNVFLRVFCSRSLNEARVVLI